MLIDYVLSSLSGICLFATSFLALLVTTRPPSENRRIFYEVAFGLIGTVGVGAIILGGIRTAATSNKLEYHVGRIDTAASRTIPGKIDTQTDRIGTLNAQVSTQGEQLRAVQDENGVLAAQNGKLLAQNALLQGIMKQIATAAHLDAAPEGSAQQLADAIIERLSSVNRRVSALEQRSPDSLYRGAQAVAKVAQISYAPGGNTLSFGVVTASEELNFDRPFLFQWAVLKCSDTKANGGVAFGAVRQISYPNVACVIVGRQFQ